jgi:outer membrane receptor protein involved in Fe transport
VLAFATSLASAATTGKIGGRIVGTDTGEPVGFADVTLLPADSTQRPIGGMTNADGTFLLEAPPGRYRLRIRAISYRPKIQDGIVLAANELLPFHTALAPEAIQQEEIVVEARRKDDNEASLLKARQKAAVVGDAVSAEQVRRSPDKDAAEVLRRVTGLSVSDGKYVFVRGLGERYSSTEVDGVRIASPEQNKRVVPLDLLPANLLENIVVQKTYTADRPGEFGGGDVQVRTKDFPGRRTWQFSLSQGYAEGVTFRSLQTYRATRADIFGFGADARKIPNAVREVAGSQKLVLGTFSKATLAEVAKSFRNIWSPVSDQSIPGASYSATFGDEFKVLGRPLGIIESWSLSRASDLETEQVRFFERSLTEPTIDYAVTRSRESVQLGGISGLSYRLTPRHSLHLRGLYTNSAEDEVRQYEGTDRNWTDQTNGWLQRRNTRLMYVQRNVLSGTVEGRHHLPRLFGTSLEWKLTRSRATRLQPDRREVTYNNNAYLDGFGNRVDSWELGRVGTREFGELKDNGWGTTISASLPYRIGRLGAGRLMFGYDRQTKERKNFYRRFDFYPSLSDPSRFLLPPEFIFDEDSFDNPASPAYVTETTLDRDNYRADQRVEASYVSADIPFGPRVRGSVGVRVENGAQDVRSYDLFRPGVITAQGRLDDRDVLPSVNLTWAVTDAVNLRAGASRTLSRPDLNELSPAPFLEYNGGALVSGNPNLQRAKIDNYDVRIEAFPGLSEVVAAGFFYKDLHEPIEQVIKGGVPQILVPENSSRGHNLGLELEARTALGRVWRRLERLSLNSNATFISSEVALKPQLTVLGSTRHPLQGQASYIINTALSYSSGRYLDVAVLFGVTGRRLRTLGAAPLPDIYEQPTTTLDMTANFLSFGSTRVKFAAKNLFDPQIRTLQGDADISSYRRGRSYSVALSYGS